MDVLVIKKDKHVHIEKNIGKIFRGNNLFEFKSESDSFSLWDYNKIFGYAYLYSSFEKIPLSEVTLSIALTVFPMKLVSFLENERGLKVRNSGNGIYYVDGEIFPIQILESKQLSPADNIFLRNLRSNLSAEDVSNTVKAARERNLLDGKSVYMDRLMRANHDAFMEAMKMTEESIKIILEGAERYGWLDERDERIRAEEARKAAVEKAAAAATEKVIAAAKKLLLLGDSIEKVVEVLELPIETVEGLQRDILSS
jgi:hypothetical protein